MPRSRLALLSWVVALSFVLATALIYVDRFNLVATPPEFPDTTSLVDRILGSAEYRQAIWPVFLWTNLLFAIGFAAAVVFAAAVSSAAGGLPTFAALVTVGGIIGAIASIMPIGMVNSGVWQLYCDCLSREAEITAQMGAETLLFDISDWFNRFSSGVLAFGLIALAREAGARLSQTLRSWTYLTAIALFALPVLGTIGRFDPAPELLFAIVGVVLVPVWAVWLGRSVDPAREVPPEPATSPVGG